MDFSPLKLADINKIRPFFNKLASRTCDFSVGGMFMWRDFFHMEFALANDTFFSRLQGDDGDKYYNLPLSDNLENSLAQLIESELAEKGSIKFCTVPEIYLQLFNQKKYAISLTEQREFFDYLYAAQDLSTLKGKKYNGVRNQISQFMRNVHTWEFRQIKETDIEQIQSFFCENYLSTLLISAGGAYEQEENRKVAEVLANLATYGMTGGVLLANNTVAGFSLNEIINDTLYTHIEKANRQFKGAYQMLMHQTAVNFATDDIRYINREEDMGDPGLERAKNAYHPVELLKKYIVEVR